MVDALDMMKRGRRIFDGNYSPRKVLLVMLATLVFLLYSGPYILRVLFSSTQSSVLTESASHSVAARVGQFKSSISSLDAHVLFTHPAGAPNMIIERQRQQEQAENAESTVLPARQFIPYVGNGYIGVWVRDVPGAASGADTLGVLDGSQLYIRHGRNLALSVPYEPLLSVHVDGGVLHEAIVTHYLSATVHKLQAWELPSLAVNHRTAESDAGVPVGSGGVGEGLEGNVEVTHKVYAHRTLPSLLLQDVVVINPNPVSVFVRVERTGDRHWAHVVSDTFMVSAATGGSSPPQQHQYTVVTGTVPAPVKLLHKHKQASANVIVVAVATLQLPNILKVDARMSTTLHVLTAVNYSAPVPQHQVHYQTTLAKEAVTQSIRSAVSGSLSTLGSSHGEAWKQLWNSGLHIATSLAENAINGDLINATIYNVLSQVRAPLQEVATPQDTWLQLAAQLSPSASEGCYQGHHTLQAEKLWSPLSTTEDVNRVVAAWLITLEKQGCHGLVKAGADGVLQAMLLSFGGLCFRNQHLEYNTQAKDLHRDLTFRHLRYGIGVHLNLTVEVQDHDYKPVLWITLEQDFLQQQPQQQGDVVADNVVGAAAADTSNINDGNKSGAGVKNYVGGESSLASLVVPGIEYINPNYIALNSGVPIKGLGIEDNNEGGGGEEMIGGEERAVAEDKKDGKDNVSNRSSGGVRQQQQQFYACDAGCLDPPVRLGSQPMQFPVKLTEPVTAVLYITSDKQHMEDLKHSIHVREVAIAPGHHQSVIALHRHGHKWGRLPPLFWLSIAALIVVFHLFLLKLVVNEYCSGDSRIRYRKLSDF